METELTLKEKFLLLYYTPSKGKPVFYSTYATYGLVGAIMLELAELKMINVDNKKLTLTDQKPTGDEALDLVIERLAKAGQQKKIGIWISSIAQSGLSKKIKAAIRNDLIKKRALSKREETALLIFKYYRYPARNTRPRRQMISEIQSVILKRKIGAKDIMMLIALIGATKMDFNFFIREDRKKARKRIREIMKNNQIAKVLDGTVSAVQAAVIAAITTTAVVSVATTSSG